MTNGYMSSTCGEGTNKTYCLHTKKREMQTGQGGRVPEEILGKDITDSSLMTPSCFMVLTTAATVSSPSHLDNFSLHCSVLVFLFLPFFSFPLSFLSLSSPIFHSCSLSLSFSIPATSFSLGHFYSFSLCLSP